MTGTTPNVDTIIQGDCLEVMKEIPDKSIDLVLTDPPYGIDYQSSWRTDKSKRFDKISNDKSPFLAWLPEAYRLLKDDGALLCFCRWDVQENFRDAITQSEFKIKSQVIWDREVHGMGDLNGAFAPCHDIIWFATKGNFRFYSTRPASVIRCQRLDASGMIHPNQKPIGLFEKLIIPCSDIGQNVLDPFLGSGTTAVAAKRTGRHFIGIELSPEYCEIARKRVAAVPARLDRWAEAEG
jgi:site-specific DNA-methyltransferase (adenine-specific)